MKTIYAIIAVVGSLLLPHLSMAQSRVLTGRVTSAGNEPLPGVSIQVKGTTKGTATNLDGNYRINIPGNDAVLVFSFIGYITRELPAGSQEVLNVTLSPDTRQLDQVVVTSLGIRREKKVLGYAVQEVSGADLTASRQSNVVNALQGKVAGVQISSTGGAPGQGARIIIRGINSLDPTRSSQPLFVVDGIPIDNETSVQGNSETRGMSNRAADINPDDIESISVLRGGAATALYGLRAANGAVIITTKSGKAGRLRVTYTASYGFERVNKIPDMQDRFSQGNNGKYDATSFWPSWGPSVEDARKLDPTHPATLYNNYKRGYETGNQVRNTVNLSGGDEKIVYAATLSQFDQKGVIPFSDYKNYSAKVNGELKFSAKFKMGASLNYINSGGSRVNSDRYGEQLIYWSPRWDLRDYVKPDGTQKTYNNETDNPMYTLSTNRFRDDVNRIIGNVNFNYAPNSWLTFLYRAGIDQYTDSRTHTGPGPKGVAGEVRNTDNGFGFVNEYSLQYRGINSTFIINLKNNITPRLTSDLKIGHDLYQTRLKRVATEGDTLDIPDLLILQNARKIVTEQYKQDYRIIGVFADWTLGWDNYLYLVLTGRNDLTSTLPVKNRSFFYPSVSASYIFTEHLKIKKDVLTYGKVRASWARIGKDATPYKLSAGFVPLTGGPIDNSVIGWTRADLLGSNELRPEYTNTFEAGAELRFLNNRIGVDFTWYTSRSKDLLIPVKISNTTGYDSYYTNSGDIQNRGMEVSLSATPVQTRKFSWDVRVNYSANRNKVIKLANGLTEVPIGNQFGYAGATATMKYIPGYPVGAIFGTSYQRYYGNGTEDPLLTDRSLPMVITRTGSLAGFPAINSGQKYLGNSQPKWMGSISNSFNYGPFQFSFLIDVRQGVQKYNQFANFLTAFGASAVTENRFDQKVFPGVYADGTTNSTAVYLQQSVGPDGRDYGGGYYRNIYRRVTENFIEDASWIRLRSASFSYELPRSMLSRTRFITGGNITITGNNLWLHTKYTGFDPESSSTSASSNADGFAGFTYPATRSFIASLQLSF